jgi:hypothetical protein
VKLSIATEPLGSTTTNPEVVAESFSAFLAGLQQSSAGAVLLQRGINVGPLPGADKCSVPWVTPANAPTLTFVEEGEARPVVDMTVDGLVVEPRFAGLAMIMTRKLLASSNAEAVVGFLLRQAASRALDTTLFSAAAGDVARPAGLLYGLTPVANSPTLGDDLETLVDAITAAGAGADVIFVTSPGRALRARSAATIDLPIYGLSVVPSSKFIAINCGAFFYSFAEAQIRTSNAATVSMRDDPGPLVSGTGTVWGPIRSLYQTAAVGLMVELMLGYCSAPGTVAFVQDPQW